MENFHHFRCPSFCALGLGGQILMVVVLCSVLTMQSTVNADADLMCYQGKIITTATGKISLSKKSLSNFELKMCRAPTTTPEPKPTTTPLLPSTNTTQPKGTTIPPSTSSNSTQSPPSTMNTTEADNSTMGSTTPSVNATSPPPSAITTTAPLTTQNLPAARTDNSSSSDMSAPSTSAQRMTSGSDTTPSSVTNDEIPHTTKSSQKRRKRSGTDILTNHDPSHDSNFTCQVFYYPTTKDGSYTLEFSCAMDLCASEKQNIMMDGKNGTLLCCNGTACNSPEIVIDQTEPEISVEILKNCSSYNEDGKFQSVPCLNTDTHMCLNVTKKGSNVTEYTCGNKESERLYCKDEGEWFTEKCTNNTDGSSYCCYVKPTYMEGPPEDKPSNSSVGVIIGIIVAFVTGLFLGCVGLVFLQKKCGKGRTAGIEMDFSYSRFQSADSGTEEL